MTNLRGIRSRIKSVQSTKKITKAMQMISATKMKKSEDAAIKAIPYKEGIFEIVNKIGKVKNYKSSYTRTQKVIKNIAILIIGPNQGFVGSLTTNLLLNSLKEINSLKQQYKDVKLHGISIYKLGLKIVNSVNIDSLYHFSDLKETPTTTDLSSIYKVIREGFASKQLDIVYISYMHFINTLVQKAIFTKLLPINISNLQEHKPDQNTQNVEYTFEPNSKEVLDKLIPEYFESQILTAILESKACEHSARMVAMKNATDNASELIDNLTLDYNKSRQSGITQELLELSMEIN